MNNTLRYYLRYLLPSTSTVTTLSTNFKYLTAPDQSTYVPLRTCYNLLNQHLSTLGLLLRICNDNRRIHGDGHLLNNSRRYLT